MLILKTFLGSLLLCLILAGSAFCAMVTGPGMHWYYWTDGDNANPGGFNTAAAGVNRALSATPFITIDGTDITATVTATTTIITIGGDVGHSVTSDDEGNTVLFSGGTLGAGTYLITASDSGANTWTLSRSAGTDGQTGTGRMGGARAIFTDVWLELVGADDQVGKGNSVFLKGPGTYTLTENISVAATSNNAASGNFTITGYSAAAGVGAVPAVADWPTIAAGAYEFIFGSQFLRFLKINGTLNRVVSSRHMLGIRVTNSSETASRSAAFVNSSGFFIAGSATSENGTGLDTSFARVHIVLNELSNSPTGLRIDGANTTVQHNLFNTNTEQDILFATNEASCSIMFNTMNGNTSQAINAEAGTTSHNQNIIAFNQISNTTTAFVYSSTDVKNNFIFANNLWNVTNDTSGTGAPIPEFTTYLDPGYTGDSFRITEEALMEVYEEMMRFGTSADADLESGLLIGAFAQIAGDDAGTSFAWIGG